MFTVHLHEAPALYKKNYVSERRHFYKSTAKQSHSCMSDDESKLTLLNWMSINCRSAPSYGNSVVGWDVSYGAEFVPVPDSILIIQTATKMTPSDEPLKGISQFVGASIGTWNLKISVKDTLSDGHRHNSPPPRA
ncbi:hypothetical protein RchiOBHm_Chr3g0496501 [Rosa chinensis]|uniref:Uncharacterized protein n=1 Tax=Rosa chinensis TaxID=74649 RepID=A0A2P6RHI6_ROSCH|nr:hypothetical protein RchiOBHm_Chr3g0496501 [Rosa chinensis]